jgi:hypothetical protein
MLRRTEGMHINTKVRPGLSTGYVTGLERQAKENVNGSKGIPQGLRLWSVRLRDS